MVPFTLALAKSLAIARSMPVEKDFDKESLFNSGMAKGSANGTLGSNGIT